MSDLTYTKMITDQARLYFAFADNYYCCNFIPGAEQVEENIKSIFFYPKWMHDAFKENPNASLAQAFKRGYEVIYDVDNTMEILHWNSFSNQTIGIDPHNIIVPDDTRDLFGYELEMYVLKQMSQVMTFDGYFLEQIALKRNATATVTHKFSSRLSILPLLGINDVNMRGIIPAAGTIFWAVIVPRAKPKSIVSILIDPFDMYVWISYFILVLTMAVTLSFFGEVLGRRHFVEIVLELIMISLAGPSRAYGGSFENRIITVFCVMGIVLISSYQSLIISFMSYVRYHPEINTLAEIQEQCVFKDDKDTNISISNRILMVRFPV
uniref:Ionotropic glutamate receptor C-terminal domain-containing protein n=1 Tax=Anopheles stephensi TaxID=30069 RepID=A0A182YGU2_ANOST